MVFVIPALWAVFFGVLGLPNSWPMLLENAIDLFKDRGPVGTILGLLGTVYKTIVFLPFECPEFLSWLPSWIQWLLFRQKAKLYAPTREQIATSKVNNEYWIFVNGVATTSDIGLKNVSMLQEVFSRPVWLCHNPTDGIIVDLLECVAGKLGFFDWFWEPKPKRLLTESVRAALYEAESGKYTRVVLIAHSQGTIITSHALQILSGGTLRTQRLMKKYLEVVAIANCAQQMPGYQLKYLENISNKGDTVAWLGALFPFKDFWEDKYGQGIEIGGSFVTEPYLWGHLLNAHYLYHMKKGKYKGIRLHDFRDGGVPSQQNNAVVVKKSNTVGVVKKSNARIQ
jgi:hypothetical protein